VNIFKYKDTWQSYLESKVAQIKGIPPPPAPPPTQPWYTKDFLPTLLQQPEYLRDYDDTPFVLDDSNPQVFFLNKIIEMQKGKDTIVFLSAVNDRLLPEQVDNPGYQENLAGIDRFFTDKNLIYLNTYPLIDNQLFSDHIHLTGDGYYFLSRMLLKEMDEWK
jgi:hypothetical protein